MEKELETDYSDSDSDTEEEEPILPLIINKKKKQVRLESIEELKPYEDIIPITKRKYVRKNPINVEDMNKKLEKARLARKPKKEKPIPVKETSITNNYYYSKEKEKEPIGPPPVLLPKPPTVISKPIIIKKPTMQFV
jgi:hypothetical protein